MVKYLVLLLSLFLASCSPAYATNFTDGSVLTAAQLNAAFATADITGGTIDNTVIGGTVAGPGTFTNFTAQQSSTQTTGTYSPFTFYIGVAPTGNTTTQVNGIASNILYNSSNSELPGGWLTPIVSSVMTQGTGTLDKVVDTVSQISVEGGNITAGLGFEAEILGLASASQITQWSGFYVPNMLAVPNIGNVGKFVGYDMEDETGSVQTVAFLSNINAGSTKYAFLGNGTAQSLFNGPVIAAGGISTTTLSATGAITPSQTAGIVGTTTNNAANAGSIGEVIAASVPSTSAISLATGTAANVTGVSLTAGDWRCTGVTAFHPAATTSVTNYSNGLSGASASFGALGTYASHSTAAQVLGAAPDEIIALPVTQVLIASTTTIYMIAESTFTVSTMAAYGSMLCTRTR